MNELEPVQQNTLVPLAALYPHVRNFRNHPPSQIAQLKASLERWGQVRSIVAQLNADGSYTIVAGHGLVQAAQELVDANMSYLPRFGKLRVDVIPASWPAEQVSGYIVADNLLSNEAEDDEVVLAQLLREQADAGYDLASMGTDDEALRQMLEALGDGYLGGGGQEEGDGGDEFDVTPPEGPTRTHVGEIWVLGLHRLLVGDCTDVKSVARLLNGDLADCCWTDPPYGVSYVGKTKDALTIQNDGKENIDTFLKRTFAAIDTALEDGAAIYIAHPAGALCITFGNHFIAQGWRFHQTLIWVKDSMVLGHSDYHFQHEPIYFGYKSGQGRRGRGGKGWYGNDSQKSIFDIPRPKRSEDHPTTKPVALVEAMLCNSTPPKGIVYDPFGGSGTTLVAAHRLQRRCYLCEIDPRYADVILARYEAETGEMATLLERVEEAVHV